MREACKHCFYWKVSLGYGTRYGYVNRSPERKAWSLIATEIATIAKGNRQGRRKEKKKKKKALALVLVGAEQFSSDGGMFFFFFFLFLPSMMIAACRLPLVAL